MRSSGPLTRFSSAAALFFSACSGAPPPEPSQVAPPPPKTPEARVCAAGSADCDGDRRNACEAQLDASPKHCGACGTACADGEACAAGSCRRAAVLSAGQDHVCAVLPSGGVRCWGDNANGQLGDGTTTVRPTPVDVTGVAGAVSVRVGPMRSCAVLASGKIACWGDQETAKVVAGFEDAIDAVARYRGLCAVRRSGEVACADLSVGEGKKPEVKTMPGVAGAVAIVAGQRHTCALIRSGEVVCWGHAWAIGAGDAKEGRGRAEDDQPRKVKGLHDAVQIASLIAHTCAVRKTGQVSCWGSNVVSRLVGTPAEENPELVTEEYVSDAVEVATSRTHACAVRRTGEVACWGSGSDGELGQGKRALSYGPVPVKGLTDATNITAGSELTCARRRSGQVVCWGSSRRGKLGNGAKAEHPLPVEVEGVTDATAVALGSYHSCALRRDGGATCWGRGSFSQDRDEYRPRGIPATPMKAVAGIVELRSSSQLACGVKTSGEVICFRGGVPAFTEEDPQENDRWLPSAAKGLGPAKAAVASGFVGVALLRSGQPVFWDTEGVDSGGTPTRSQAITTRPIPGVTDAIDVAVNDSAACVVRRSGQVSCQRFPMLGALDKKNATRPGPVTVIPDINDAVQVSAGLLDLCAARRTGEVACFSYFDLPEPIAKKPPVSKEPPRGVRVRVTEGITDATMVAAGGGFHCALLRSGEVACSGSNAEGQLGDGGFEDAIRAVRVKGISDAVHIAAGMRHVCAVRKSGRVACWGSNDMDQVGHSDPPVFLLPTPVQGLP